MRCLVEPDVMNNRSRFDRPTRLVAVHLVAAEFQ